TMQYSDIMDPLLLADALMGSPQYPIAMLLFAAAVIPTVIISYRYHFAQFLAKDLGLPSGSAIRASKYFMRGNIWKIIRLELSFWYYVLPVMIPTAIFTAEMIGYSIIPEQYTVLYNAVSNLYLFGIYILGLPKYAVTHAAFYDAVTAQYRREREERMQPQINQYNP
ncbi:MAG: DUF975 family protein, partial [Oscillospiraceae bacterium]|nr:DUF975 family protein [Oscillospiraceae bacterium]